MVVALANGPGPQRARPVRVFAYDPLAIEALSQAAQSKTMPETPAVAEAQMASKTGRRPGQNAPSYVNISGNFGGVFYVTGIGSATSQSQSNFISITTNRALTFSANSFKPLLLGNSSEGAMGSVTYTMTLYQGTPAHVGALVSGPVSGTDVAFNGQTVAVNLAQIPADGNLVLMISRTLNLTGQATGASTLVGTGNIGVTIN